MHRGLAKKSEQKSNLPNQCYFTTTKNLLQCRYQGCIGIKALKKYSRKDSGKQNAFSEIVIEYEKKNLNIQHQKYTISFYLSHV